MNEQDRELSMEEQTEVIGRIFVDNLRDLSSKSGQTNQDNVLDPETHYGPYAFLGYMYPISDGEDYMG